MNNGFSENNTVGKRLSYNLSNFSIIDFHLSLRNRCTPKCKVCESSKSSEFREAEDILELYTKLSRAPANCRIQDQRIIENIFLDSRSYMKYRKRILNLHGPALVLASTSAEFNNLTELEKLYGEENKWVLILQDPFILYNDSDFERIIYILTIDIKRGSIYSNIKKQLSSEKRKAKRSGIEVSLNNNIFLVESEWRRPKTSKEQKILDGYNAYIGEIYVPKQFRKIDVKYNAEPKEDLEERIRQQYF